MAKPELTPEYCESQYNARAAIPEHPAIFARWAEHSEAARSELPCQLDIAYGAGPKERLDLFPAQGRSRALFVFMHGGYWRSLDKADFSFIAGPLTAAGATVALLNYGLCPSVTVRDIVRQTRSAHAWLWRNAQRYGADPNAIYTSGHSAGGHLTAMQFTADWRESGADLPADLIKGGLAVSGVYDLEPMLYFSYNQDIRLDEAAVAELSPVNLKPRTKAPLYLAVGGLESDDFKRQSDLLAECWKECPVSRIPMPGFHHLGVIEQLAEPESPLFQGALQLMGLR
jgi:arylformamidase